MNTDKKFMKLYLNYFVVAEYMNVVNTLFGVYETKKLTEKLHLTFIALLFSIVKDEMAKIKGDILFYDLYNNLSREKRLEIQKFISNNLDVFEIVFAPIYKDYEAGFCSYRDYSLFGPNVFLYALSNSYNRLKTLKYTYLLQNISCNKLNLIKHRYQMSSLTNS